ncbi:MAG: HD domain-containing protein, partial [Pseudomonadota bacterium]
NRTIRTFLIGPDCFLQKKQKKPLMIFPDIEAFIEVFTSYAENFRQGSQEDLINIDHKLTHSLRVLQNARVIVRSLHLGSACSHTALLAALFHDIGRFPQYFRHKTFLDAQSEDHGLLGAKTLQQTKFLSGLDSKKQKEIIGAVFLHNRYHLPKHVAENIRLITNIVRDADKLDILPSVISNLAPDSDRNPAITLHLAPHPAAYTETVYLDVMAGRMAKYEELRWLHDFTITLCGWVFDLNFPASRQLFVEQGYLESLIGNLPETPEIQALEQRIRKELLNCAAMDTLDLNKCLSAC